MNSEADVNFKNKVTLQDDEMKAIADKILTAFKAL